MNRTLFCLLCNFKYDEQEHNGWNTDAYDNFKQSIIKKHNHHDHHNQQRPQQNKTHTHIHTQEKKHSILSFG